MAERRRRQAASLDRRVRFPQGTLWKIPPLPAYERNGAGKMGLWCNGKHSGLRSRARTGVRVRLPPGPLGRSEAHREEHPADTGAAAGSSPAWSTDFALFVQRTGHPPVERETRVRFPHRALTGPVVQWYGRSLDMGKSGGSTPPGITDCRRGSRGSGAALVRRITLVQFQPSALDDLVV